MVKALGNRVILEIVENLKALQKEYALKGILLADTMIQGQPKTGIVYSINEKLRTEIKAGDCVVFTTSDQVFPAFRQDGKKFVSVNIDDISGVIL